jgi:hypothetical protein
MWWKKNNPYKNRFLRGMEIGYTLHIREEQIMNLRCTYCQTPFTVGRLDKLAALQRMLAENLHHYDAICPRCRRANSVSRERLQIFTPGWREGLINLEAEAAQANTTAPAPPVVAATPVATPVPETVSAPPKKRHAPKSAGAAPVTAPKPVAAKPAAAKPIPAKAKPAVVKAKPAPSKSKPAAKKPASTKAKPAPAKAKSVAKKPATKARKPAVRKK